RPDASLLPGLLLSERQLPHSLKLEVLGAVVVLHGTVEGPVLVRVLAQATIVIGRHAYGLRPRVVGDELKACCKAPLQTRLRRVVLVGADRLVDGRGGGSGVWEV